MRARLVLVKSAATLIALSVLLILAPAPHGVAAQETEAPPGAPKLDAGSWALIDADTGLYLTRTSKFRSPQRPRSWSPSWPWTKASIWTKK